MSEPDRAGPSRPLQRALAAERDALKQIERAREEARSIVSDAEVRAREIERRATRRISRVSRTAQSEIDRLLEIEREQEETALSTLVRSEDDHEVLEDAVVHVAALLTSTPPDQSDD